ncbi:L-lysine 6-transaminase [Candidatus Marinimicrobia bacterium MT.SAG.2]|nr:L-lysine 6-transaminase [Candidatus Marinimicrobia bacterium MT.SAG.2]
MQINANKVKEVLSKHVLTDGIDPIFDEEQSEGSWFVDKRNGRKYLDLFSFFASSPVGFNHSRIRGSAEKLGKIAKHKPTNSDIYTDTYAEFVQTFSEIGIPEELPYAFFIEGGTLGVENALKAAFDWKVRKNLSKGKAELGSKIIHFRNAFHGRSGYTLSLTNTEEQKIKYFPKFDWPRIDSPAIRFPLEENLDSLIEEEKKSVDQIKKAISDYPDNIAAIIIESIQSEGGDNHFRGEFLAELRTIADESELMLIFDEVQTGVGLTGKFWAYEHLGVKPDMIAFGKKMQVCGFLSSTRIDDIEENVFKSSGRLNSTFGGNLVDMARTTIYLEIIRDEGLLEKAEVTGKYLLYRIEALQDEFSGFVSNARGRGLFCAFDLPTSDDRNKLIEKIMDNGALILGCGEKSIRFRPSLNISTDNIDRGIEIIEQSIKSHIS